ncbi:MAG TPA: hypothetical protein VIF62_16170 [Labilithrix sp.]|jgi:hypothetical protein
MRYLIVTVFVCLLAACDDETDLNPAPHDSGAGDASADAAREALKDAGSD